MCKKLLKKWICDDYMLGELKEAAQDICPSEFIVLSMNQCGKILINEFGEHLTSDGIDYSDIKFYVYDKNVRNIFNRIYAKYRPFYISDMFNCDDFAFDYVAILRRFTHFIKGAKYSFAINIVWGYFPWIGNSSKRHATNSFIDNMKINGDNNICGALYEPQSNRTYYSTGIDDKWEGTKFKIKYF